MSMLEIILKRGMVTFTLKKITWVQLQILGNDSDRLLFIPTEDNFPIK